VVEPGVGEFEDQHLALQEGLESGRIGAVRAEAVSEEEHPVAHRNHVPSLQSERRRIQHREPERFQVLSPRGLLPSPLGASESREHREADAVALGEDGRVLGEDRVEGTVHEGQPDHLRAQ